MEIKRKRQEKVSSLLGRCYFISDSSASALNLLLLWYSNCLLPPPRDSHRAEEEEEVKWGSAVYRHFIAVTHWQRTWSLVSGTTLMFILPLTFFLHWHRLKVMPTLNFIVSPLLILFFPLFWSRMSSYPVSGSKWLKDYWTVNCYPVNLWPEKEQKSWISVHGYRGWKRKGRYAVSVLANPQKDLALQFCMGRTTTVHKMH